MTVLAAIREVWRYAQAHRAGLLVGSTAAMLIVPYLILLLVTTFEVRLLSEDRRNETRKALQELGLVLSGVWWRRYDIRFYLVLRKAYIKVLKNSVAGTLGIALFWVLESVWWVILVFSSAGAAWQAWVWLGARFW
jgi:hypothetical protein